MNIPCGFMDADYEKILKTCSFEKKNEKGFWFSFGII